MHIKNIVIDDGVRNLQVDFNSKINDNYKFIISTHDDMDSEFDLIGAIIYANIDDLSKSLKIYKDYAEIHLAVDCNLFNCAITHHYDIDLIKNLQQKQKNIKLTQFPTGIVTYKGYIIGQEMPFYVNCIDLLKYCQTLGDNNVIINQIIKCIQIIQELYENGIVYIDVHPQNFLVDSLGGFHLIDFDNKYVSFSIDDIDSYNRMIDNLKCMIKDIFKLFNISLENIDCLNSLEDILDSLQSILEIKKR